MPHEPNCCAEVTHLSNTHQNHCQQIIELERKDHPKNNGNEFDAGLFIDENQLGQLEIDLMDKWDPKNLKEIP